MSEPLPELKCCPFCGNAPKLRIDPLSNFGRDCWSWINCTMCWVKPHVGACVSTGYRQNHGNYAWVPTYTEKEASEMATQTVIRRWNERHPKDQAESAPAS